jgi:hypothetical protein
MHHLTSNIMKYSGFSKQIPITEEQYHAFKDQQRKEAKHAEEELARPDELLPLVAAQNEKAKTLFTSTKNPELQEQRLAHLTSIINNLKQKIDLLDVKRPEAGPVHSVEKPKDQTRAEAFLAALGNDVWNDAGELVIEGNVVPNTNKEELTNFMSSNWRKKYNINKPAGAMKMFDIVKEKKISDHLLGPKIRNEMMQKMSDQNRFIKGLALVSKKKAAERLRQRSSEKLVTTSENLKRRRQDAVEEGYQILNDGKKFQKFVAKRM